MVVINDNTLFVHFPKTGGTFVREILKQLPCKSERLIKDGFHRSHASLESVNRERFDFIFGVVRNPITWYESVWKFYVDFKKNNQTFKKEDWHPFSDLENVFSNDFQQFIKGCLKEYPGHYSKCIDEYFDGVFVIKMETLAFDLSRILTEIGVKHDPKKIINAPHYGQREKHLVWNPNDRAKILENEFNVINKYYLNETSGNI